jgi:hypothetical protein
MRSHFMDECFGMDVRVQNLELSQPDEKSMK